AQLPVLLVGRSKQLGFESGAWNLALTAASYPQQSNLPADYRFAPVQPAAPRTQAKPEQPADSASSTAPAAMPQRLPATGNAPPGFRF
ncbi:MAG: glutaredoxin family protein, partial [Oxalobacteraceae bacterium]